MEGCGSWQILGECTFLAPGQTTEARGWIYGCWLLLQAVLGKRQVNMPRKASWTALSEGARSTAAPDLWRNLPDGKWLRLQTLHVPPKLLKEQGVDGKAWLQYQEAKQSAQARASKERPWALGASARP